MIKKTKIKPPKGARVLLKVRDNGHGLPTKGCYVYEPHIDAVYLLLGDYTGVAGTFWSWDLGGAADVSASVFASIHPAAVEVCEGEPAQPVPVIKKGMWAGCPAYVPSGEGKP